VTSDAEPFVMAAGGSAVAEYDVPPDAWYFEAERSPRMPFAVLQEVSLQACGWLAVYMGSALTSDDDLHFRNLGGSATLHVEATPETGTLSTRVKATRVSRSGGMIIQHYSFETRDRQQLVYSGETYFGFFRPEALADQVGIREATPYELTADESARARSFDFPREAPFPDDRLRMIDRVEGYVADGGPHGLGVIIGTGAVDRSAWYFDAHFFQDPVCPGSLGLESFLQLLKVVGFERWGRDLADPSAVVFETMAPGDTHRWVYRGQIVPGDGRITVRLVVTAADDGRKWLKADGFLDVDGRLIYQMNDFTLRLT
jgi:3-hydroxymyristoyl/3-hydroxydecanoyl-(acyl carrier protein) dehydratase